MVDQNLTIDVKRRDLRVDYNVVEDDLRDVSGVAFGLVLNGVNNPLKNLKLLGRRILQAHLLKQTDGHLKRVAGCLNALCRDEENLGVFQEVEILKLLDA